MSTKNTYGLRIAIGFSAFILCMLIGSFVVSSKYIDLGYIAASIVFGIKYFRMEG